LAEVKKLMRLVNVEAVKTKLGEEGKEVIGYPELLKVCESMGVARSVEEAAAFAKVLDEAGVVLLFRDQVYLHPDKVLFLFYFMCLLRDCNGMISMNCVFEFVNGYWIGELRSFLFGRGYVTYLNFEFWVKRARGGYFREFSHWGCGPEAWKPVYF